VVDNLLHGINPSAQRNTHQNPQGKTENHEENIELGHPQVLGVDDYSYVGHSPRHKPEREPLRGVCGSYLRRSWNVEMSSL
jgi:hypothetical protein